MAGSDSHLSATPESGGILGHWVPPVFVDFSTATDHVIGQRHHLRPDLLAEELYGNSRLSWLFALYNRNELRDPVWDFTEGRRIKVPSRQAARGA